MKAIHSLAACAGLLIGSLAAAGPAIAAPAIAAGRAVARPAAAPVTVVPSAGLAGGDTVLVTAAGITLAATVQVIQCNIYTGDPEQDCYPRTTVTAGSAGKVSVHVSLADPVYKAEPEGDPTPIYCRADICRIFLAWQDQDGNQQVLSSGVLRFTGSPATITASQSTGLPGHEVVHVTGTARGASWHEVKILEEACYSIVQGSGCYGQYPSVSTIVGRNGTYSVLYRVRRFLPDGTDCASPDILGFCELSVIVIGRNGQPDDSFGVSLRGQPALPLSFGAG
jgi:hypothetical protein